MIYPLWSENFFFLLFICAYNVWVISPPSPHQKTFFNVTYFETGSHYEAQTGFELEIILLQPPETWDYREKKKPSTVSFYNESSVMSTYYLEVEFIGNIMHLHISTNTPLYLSMTPNQRHPGTQHGSLFIARRERSHQEESRASQ
jgi:hypothetical protein